MNAENFTTFLTSVLLVLVTFFLRDIFQSFKEMQSWRMKHQVEFAKVETDVEWLKASQTEE